jgi:hypothetical protein
MEVAMRKNIRAMALAALACAVVRVAAQTQPPAPPTPAVPVEQVTIIGCVVDTTPDPSATGTTATSTRYKLTNARPGSSAGSTDAAAAATSGTGTSEKAGGTYRLSGDDSTIRPEVGHLVEILGVIEDPGTTSSSTTAATGTSGSVDLAPKMKVQTIRMIAAQCSE